MSCCGSSGLVTLAPGVVPAGPAIMDRLGQVSEMIGGVEISLVSGDRTPYQAWELRMRYLNGTGNLAAQCCHLTGKHSWSACGKTPRSNHARGAAADCGTVRDGQGYQSIGYDNPARSAMKQVGLCLPVPGEPWHVEQGSIFRA